ncbi:Guanylate kinase (GMP kinase) [Durusdinium trenchii]|uniref:Guanylate kinase (GMP kinase) n=1 Tax=Durusdinium trenchii TaxID=1381693 RepID=A0ABP0QES8_9DINO
MTLMGLDAVCTPLARVASPRRCPGRSQFGRNPGGSGCVTCGRGVSSILVALACKSQWQSPRARKCLLRASGDAPVAAAARRAQRVAEYERMKRQSLLDAGAVGLLGALLAYANNGSAASEGWLVGAVFGTIYLVLLYQDVSVITVDSNPFSFTNPLRILRFLLPFGMVVALGLQHASIIGLEEWWQKVSWEPGVNFTGVVSSPAMLFGALLAYASVSAVLPLRGLVETLPEARTLMKAVPGSLGVALQLADAKEKDDTEDVEVVPVLLITGPRGCGKSTLAKELMKKDHRFQEPEWVATKPCSSMGSSQQRLVALSDFQALEDSRSLAVSYRPAGDDLEEVELGLPAMSVLSTAQEHGACILDVDPPTARFILSYSFDRALSAAFPEKKTEMRLVTVWVSMQSLDDIMERNRRRLEEKGLDSEMIQEQLKSLRAQVTSDMEWALTNSLDFTVINEDKGAALSEVVKASRYCFEDPF